YMVYMDEHGDAEGNYSLVGRQMGPSGYGLYPVGAFTRHSNMSLPVRSILDIEVPEAPDGDGQRGPKTIQ
ncbi:hypothetical protein WDU94_009830, partial [Cyamophila willieti]